MATLLDASLIKFLMPVFVFLFILVAIYALLSKTELFGKSQAALNLIAAMCIAAVAVFAGNLVTLFGSVIPWIVFIIVILVLIFGLYKMFGMKDEEIWNAIGGQITVYVVILIILLIGLSSTFKSEVSPFPEERSGVSQVTTAGTGVQGKSVQSEVIKTLTHPRLLGALFILLVASFAVRLLIDKVEK